MHTAGDINPALPIIRCVYIYIYIYVYVYIYIYTVIIFIVKGP